MRLPTIPSKVLIPLLKQALHYSTRVLPFAIASSEPLSAARRFFLAPTRRSLARLLGRLLDDVEPTRRDATRRSRRICRQRQSVASRSSTTNVQPQSSKHHQATETTNLQVIKFTNHAQLIRPIKSNQVHFSIEWSLDSECQISVWSRRRRHRHGSNFLIDIEQLLSGANPSESSTQSTEKRRKKKQKEAYSTATYANNKARNSVGREKNPNHSASCFKSIISWPPKL